MSKQNSKSIGLRVAIGTLCLIILFGLGIYATLGPLLLVSVAVIIGLLLVIEAVLPDSPQKQRISRGLCPYCEQDLNDIRPGTEYCPLCKKPIPAPLRKWTNRSG